MTPTLPEEWNSDTPVDDKLRWLHATYKNPPPEHLGKLPKPTNKNNEKGRCNECGGWHGLPAVHLDYMGHAEVTDVLCWVDPQWNWEPFATDERGLPAIMANDKGSVLWIRLTVWGVTRPGVGTSEPKGPDTMKELIGDAIRNAAMRFGIGTGLWSKIDGVDRKIQSGQDVEADSDHDPAAPVSERSGGNRPIGRAAVPDRWTAESLGALDKPTLNKMLLEHDLPTSRPKDWVQRLLDWQAANATPTAPATSVPADTRPEDETPAELPTKPPPVDQHPDDGTDPAPTRPTVDESEAPDEEDEYIDPDELLDEPPDAAEWNAMPADPASIEAILADVKKLSGAKARAYAGYKREKKIPAKPAEWTNGQLEGIVAFLDLLEEPA